MGKNGGSRSAVTMSPRRGSNSIERRPGCAASSGRPLGGITMDGKDFVDTSPMDGLYSGRVLPAIVQALDIEDEVLNSRTARRVLRRRVGE